MIARHIAVAYLTVRRRSHRMRLPSIISLGSIILMLCGCTHPSSRWTATGPITAWSVVADLRSSAERECAKLRVPYLLALQAEVDSRPWYVERALLAFQCDEGAWWLITAARNPHGTPEWRHHWSVAEAVDAWYGAQQFDHRPTESDVRRFLAVTEWHASPRDDWHRLRAEVFAADWRAALGFDPVFEFVATPPNHALQRL